MSTTQQMKTNAATTRAPQKTWSLDHISLGFEYNKTLQEIKREVRARTI